MYRLRDVNNRGKTHLFLGDALSNGIDKTVVEPGNAFSPGLWTLGISLAVRQGELSRHRRMICRGHLASKCRPSLVNMKLVMRMCAASYVTWAAVDGAESIICASILTGE